MRFASPFPWWLTVLLLLGAALVTYGAYAHPTTPLSARRRSLLMGLRFTVLLILLLVLAQPVRLEPVAAPRVAVPVLLDRSLSMGIADMAGERRIDAAVSLIRDRIAPALGDAFQLDLWSFGETLEPLDLATVRAEARRSDLAGALDAVRRQYVDEPVAGVVVVSDGGETGIGAPVPGAGPPVFTVGVGAPTVQRDREVIDLTAGEAVVAGTVIDLGVSAVAHGFGREPFEIRVIEDGQQIRSLRVTPDADGAVARAVVPVSPKPEAATLYTVEIPVDSSELVPENNRRSVLVQPPGRPRRVLLVEGAPGFDHSFLKRALDGDIGLQVDAVIHKGQNDRGERTFYIQGPVERTRALATGFPSTREALFAYDAVILANIEAELLRPAHIEMTVDFVSERGGGLLVMGARSFEGAGLRETAIEPLLPLALTGRAGPGTLRWSNRLGVPHRLALTADGEQHPIMRLGETVADTRRRWAAVPALGEVVPLGARRPGAAVLATGRGEDATELPMIAVQRFGRGRTMVVAGEASWRWQMLLPSTDDTHQRFWRQTARWLASEAPDRVRLRTEGGRAEGDPLHVEIVVGDARFVPVVDADLQVVVTDPNGERRAVVATLVPREPGRYVAEITPRQRGVHHLTTVARRGDVELGTADLAVLVGGADLELTDPRRHDPVLQRVARTTGGEALEEGEVQTLSRALRAGVATGAPPVARDLWDTVWAFLLLVGLLSAEWGLRRRWGLR